MLTKAEKSCGNFASLQMMVSIQQKVPSSEKNERLGYSCCLIPFNEKQIKFTFLFKKKGETHIDQREKEDGKCAKTKLKRMNEHVSKVDSTIILLCLGEKRRGI